MNHNVTIFRSYLEAYNHFFKPLCKELDMPQMALDILLCLANNPEIGTAKEISQQRGFRKNILSINIEKLVSQELLERLPVEGDRRKVQLACTQKAQPIIERAKRLHTRFQDEIRAGLTAEELKVCQHCLAVAEQNAQRIMRMEIKEEELSE